MNAITLYQPGAEQLMRAEHPVIQRNFRPTEPGRILLHVSNKRDRLQLNAKGTVDFDSGLAVAEMNFGEIIGAANVVDVVTRTRDVVPAKILTRYPWLPKVPRTGPYVWILSNIVRFAKPIRCTAGLPGLWAFTGPLPPEADEDHAS